MPLNDDPFPLPPPPPTGRDGCLSPAQLHQLAHHLEQLGLMYLRSFAHLRQALETQSTEAINHALAECAPLLEGWSRSAHVYWEREHERTEKHLRRKTPKPVFTQQVVNSGELHRS